MQNGGWLGPDWGPVLGPGPGGNPELFDKPGPGPGICNFGQTRPGPGPGVEKNIEPGPGILKSA